MLNNIEYNAYIMNILALARTIVIKCEDMALLDNKLMFTHWGINPDPDKAKWRYYLNLNGEYHQTDEMMQVQSLDNGETIDFTKENLEIHLATKRAYRQGSYYFSRLTDKYQGQSELIKGIINPIPPSESIPAKNYQILRYNTDYVLWNEYQLIPKLQDHVYNMVKTSFNTEYIYTDNLMLAALLCQLHGSLITAIIQFREEAAGTRYAHEFHIWSRLNSLGMSSIYKQVLDRKQVMWFYRNLENVLRLQGRKTTFDALTDIVLTHRSIPLARHIVLQNTATQLEDITSTPMFQSRPVNEIQGLGTATKLLTVQELINKEIPLAYDNEVMKEPNEIQADYRIRYGLHSNIPTKVLESTMIDVTDLNPNSIMRVLHNQWVYLVKKDLYLINHDFTDLRTGKHFRLNTKEAYILWAYLVNRYNGNGIERIGPYPYYRARKVIVPNYKILQSLGDPRILSEPLCKDIVKSNPAVTRVISPDAFYEMSRDVFHAIWDQSKLASRVTNMYWVGQIQNAVDACYETGLANFDTGVTYQKWLSDRDLSFEDYGPEEMLDLAWSIWQRVTGWENAQYITLADQQRTLINLMKDLTSYTVQYIGSTDSSLGNYQLGFQPLMETDYYTGDDGNSTGLESENPDQIIPGQTNQGVPESETYFESKSMSIEGNMLDHLEIESIGEGYIPGACDLIQMEDPDPEPWGVMLTMAYTLVEVPNSRG